MEQSTAIPTGYLEMNFVGITATGKGNNTKIVMEDLNDGRFRITESRVGITIGRHRPKSSILPIERWDEVYLSKISRGYLVTKTRKMDQKIVQMGNSVNGMSYQPIENLQVRQIVKALLDYADAAVSENYTIKVDDISDEMLKYGKKILDTMASEYVQMSVPAFNIMLQRLYAAIPRRIDNLSKLLAKSHSEIKDIIAQEQELYDVMFSRVRTEKTASAEKNILDAFGLEWRAVTDAEKDMILQKLGGNSSQFVNAWKVTNIRTETAFNDFCQKENLSDESGVSHLWHGSKSANFWSILANGLTVNPTNVTITGKMFGRGSYFAPLAAKSLGYTSCKGSRWANGNNSTGFLALYKVATGINPYFVEFSESDLDWEILQQRCPGALCTWAKAGRALYNDEVIIYRDFQSTVEFLVELSV